MSIWNYPYYPPKEDEKLILKLSGDDDYAIASYHFLPTSNDPDKAKETPAYVTESGDEISPENIIGWKYIE